MAISITNLCFGQYIISGKITSAENHTAITSAIVTLFQEDRLLTTTISNEEGIFTLAKIKTQGEYRITVEHVSLETNTVIIEVRNKISTVELQLKNRQHFLETLEVKSLKASNIAPFAKTNLTKEYIQKNNFGQDLPYILNQTPSAVINSDAGNGIGYTGIRIRGSDATRINVTINGIPYNDAESQGTYFVDLPDIASSVNSIQIQRGVGSSSNGAGAFGATIHLSTNEFNDKPYAELNNSYGSFNSWKNTVKAGTGLINDHFTVDTRISRISSDGYIDRASSNLKSLYFSTAYINKKSTLRFNYFGGTEKTYQAWNGVAENMLQTDRTMNSVGTEKPGEPYDNETDNYKQEHFQLFFNQAINTNLSFNTGIFLIKGKGYYEQYKADQAFADYGLNDPIINGSPLTNTDLIRQLWLDNDFFGQIFSLEYKKPTNQLTFGGGWNRYNGNHFGEVIWANAGIPKNYRWYQLDANKTDINFYTKWELTLNKQFNLYADVQYRNVDYTINGFRDNPTVRIDRPFNFINPKAGITYKHKNMKAFFSYSLGNKEPNRDDFEAGKTLQPKHETLHDFEAGYEHSGASYTWGFTSYYMLYRNQLILTGQINDVGAYTRVNVSNSYRMGVELQGNTAITSWLNASANIAFSKNKISDFDEYFDDYDNGGQVKSKHKNATIAFSPATVGSTTINFIPMKNSSISFTSKYVSRQYLDNTGDPKRSLNPYFVQDIRAGYVFKKMLFKECSITASVNNVFNKKYEANGYTYSYISGGTTTTENFYFPMATTNYIVAINIKL